MTTDTNPMAALAEAMLRHALANCHSDEAWEAAKGDIAAMAEMSAEDVAALAGGPERNSMPGEVLRLLLS